MNHYSCNFVRFIYLAKELLSRFAQLRHGVMVTMTETNVQILLQFLTGEATAGIWKSRKIHHGSNNHEHASWI